MADAMAGARVRIELAHATASALSPGTPALVEFDADATTARDALRTMLSREVSSAPVYRHVRNEGQASVEYVGFLDAAELAAAAVAQALRNRGGDIARSIDPAMEAPLRAWMDAGGARGAARASSRRDVIKPFVSVDATAPPLDVARLLAAGAHRVALRDASGGISTLVSPTSMLRAIIALGLAEAGDVTVGKAFEALLHDKGHCAIHASPAAEPTCVAFAVLAALHRDRAGSVALVGSGGRFVTSLTNADLRKVATDPERELCRTDFLGVPAVDFVRLAREAPYCYELVGSPTSHVTLSDVDDTVSITPADTVQALTELLLAPHVREVYMLDDAARPAAIITTADVLRFLLSGDVGGAAVTIAESHTYVADDGADSSGREG
uniref:CBS domain-containing protein n=1 Tax=Bicosoecida sp. CB-2014 TaxID=1486930 RepID=A0A7S1C4C2_9STRA|mmetsp:Transcript_13076/g.45730  ORF Transcript_13076/g.45730 Transcript_13076/m.45730 type:complete len:382 (+) Transcript_13076:94-1239(+)